jgi:hypothetical protein
MSGKKNVATTCFLDIQQLLKLDPSINYFSTCPACKQQVSDHKDTDFLREQVAKRTINGENLDDEDDHDDDGRPRKKAKVPVPAAEAVILIKKVHFVLYRPRLLLQCRITLLMCFVFS